MKRALAYAGIALAVPPSVLLLARAGYHLKERNYCLCALYIAALAIWGYVFARYLGRQL